MEPYRILWAKTSNDTTDWHPLICHLIDTGKVANALWMESFAPATRLYFSGLLGLSEIEAGNLLSFWVSLHDIGKAAPGFQRKHVPAIPILESAGFSFPLPSSKSAPHGVVSTWALENLLIQQCQMQPSWSKRIARALGGHHGTWPTSTQLLPQALKASDKGDAFWDAARQALMDELIKLFAPVRNFSWPETQEDENTFLMLFSGLTTVADWIGSMSEFFPFQAAGYEIESHAAESEQKARSALRQLGWIGWQPNGQTIPFEQMFPFSPNEIQQMTIQAGQDLTLPALVVLEAPTGSGKTEAALFLADTWLQANQGRGLYIAMPTQATSNQMFTRTSQFLLQRYPGEQLNLHLTHGAQMLAQASSAPSNVSDDEDPPVEGGIRAETWFLPRKRTLLAPFGVGTVDQALMSVLQTRHFFVRMFGLGQKVVIFDEIHAYDTYMSELFQQLLSWLRAVGTSVILLSATLPEVTRSALVSAWGGEKETEPAAAYPRLTIVSAKNTRSVPLPWSQTNQIDLTWVPGDSQALVDLLAEKLKDGGCAAVICNRVARSREVYQALAAANLVAPEDLILFHARFPYARRAQIEKAVLERFKKGGQRPQKSIVVATQVIEQSLDLDFDFMVSDLAPIDLLLQRAGRLHRHTQNQDRRPTGLRCPCLAITRPQEKEDLPTFGADEWVYEAVVLLRTWAVLQGRSCLTLPAETSELIESVYGGLMDEALPPYLRQAIQKAETKSLEDHRKEIFEAKTRLIPSLDDERLLFSKNDNLEEDDPTVHSAFAALTRLGAPSVTLVCLYQTPLGLATEPDGLPVIDQLGAVPKFDQIQKMLQCTVAVQDRRIYDYFQKRPLHPAWQTCAALRHHQPVVFDSQGRASLEGSPWVLILDNKLGLLIEKEVL
ncbi:MAG TPA: CRISPR-associated helicase Cas3' [Anaerolineaceae bacterium]|nr:CRISPR-associated helicase Cas3' [Anaerolineaceae bacterium]